MTARCNPPRCRRGAGHAGPCRDTFHVRTTCGAWMPQAETPCARLPGHRYEHRSRLAMDNAIGLLVPVREDWPFQIVLGPVQCKGCKRRVAWNGWEWKARNGYTHGHKKAAA